MDSDSAHSSSDSSGQVRGPDLFTKIRQLKEYNRLLEKELSSHGYGRENLALLQRRAQLSAQGFVCYEHEATLDGDAPNYIFAIGVLPSGRVVSAYSSGLLKVWDRSEGCVHQLTLNRARVARWGGVLVSMVGYAELKPWAFSEGGCARLLTGLEEALNCLAIMPNGHIVTATDYGGTIKLWDVAADGRCLQVLHGHSSEVVCIAVLDGRIVSGAHQPDNTIKVWDCVEGNYRCTRTLEGHEDCVRSVVVLPNGQLCSGSSDGTIKLWDLDDGYCAMTLKAHTDQVMCVVLLPDSDWCVVSASFDKTVRIWDLDVGRCLQTLSHDGKVHCVAALPDRIFCGVGSSPSARIEVWFDSQRADEKRMASDVARRRACEDVTPIVAKFI